MKRKYLAIEAFLMAVVFICVAATFQNVWTTNPFPLNVATVTNLGVLNQTTPQSLTTNSFVEFGYASPLTSANGMYIWNSTSHTYTNNGSGWYAIFNPAGPGTGGAEWDITNAITGDWDDFLVSVPVQEGFSFPTRDNNDGTMFIIFPVGTAIGAWLPATTTTVTNYTAVSASSNSFLELTNSLVIDGRQASLIVGKNCSIQANWPYSEAILGSFNCSDYGFFSGMLGCQFCTNYGGSTLFCGCSIVTCYANNNDEFFGGVEQSSFNNENGVSGGLWSQNCTNNGNTYAGIICCSGCLLQPFGAGGSVLMISALSSFAQISGNGLFIGSNNTNYGTGNIYCIGDRNFTTNGANDYVFGQNNNISNANNAMVIGMGLTNTGSGTVKIGITNANITFSNQTVTVAGTLALTGVTNGTDAASGIIGEYMHSGVGITTATLTNGNGGTPVVTLTLSAGDWDVEANISYQATSATVVPGSGSSANLSTNASYSTSETQTIFLPSPIATITTFAYSVALPRYRVSCTASTVVRARTTVLFSAGTVTAGGDITARRVR